VRSASNLYWDHREREKAVTIVTDIKIAEALGMTLAELFREVERDSDRPVGSDLLYRAVDSGP
jgi:hypothetical protein